MCGRVGEDCGGRVGLEQLQLLLRVAGVEECVCVWRVRTRPEETQIALAGQGIVL